MGAFRLAAAVSLGATILVLACSSDEEKVAPTFPEQGDGGKSSTSSTSSGGSSSGGSSGTVSGGNFCQLTKDFYARIEACCTAADKDLSPYPLLQLSDLLTQALCAQWDQSIARGRVTIDKTLEAQCTAPLKALVDKLATCPLPADYNHFGTAAGLENESCINMFVGNVLEGGACRTDTECKQGLACLGYTGESDGQCVAPRAIGETCGQAPLDGGKSALFLEYDPTHPRCAAGGYCRFDKCEAQKASGEQCSDHYECAGGLQCYQGTCGGGTARSAQGGPCKSNSDCVLPLYCAGVLSTDAGASTCQPRKAAGATCGDGLFDCQGRCDEPDGGEKKCVAWCGK